MADNNAQKTIFQRVAQRFKPDPRDPGEKEYTQAPVGHTPSQDNGSGKKGDDRFYRYQDPREQQQQQFLDWQVDSIARDLYTRTMYFDADRITSYQDFRAMDQSPEIAAALDIMRDECLDANTVIPLLSGERKTIEELYDENMENFHVYSYNPELQRSEPAICQRVIYKGEQDVYKVTFDDDSHVMATSEHLWLSNGEDKYIKTSDLKESQSIQPFYTRASGDGDRISGYEMVFEDGKWEYTHRIVKRSLWGEKKGVVHHKDFNKLNNDPSNLQVMDWFDHQKLHSSLNSDRWKNDKSYSDKMKKVFSETNSSSGPYWSDPEWRSKRVQEISDRQKRKYSNYSQEELKDLFGYSGKENPMYGKGYRLSGEKNGRYLHDKKREFSIHELLQAYNNSSTVEEACEILGTTRRILYKSKVYKSLNLQRWEDLGFHNSKISIQAIEGACENYLGQIILENNMSKICDDFNWRPKKVNTYLEKNGYGKWTDFVKKYNSKKERLNYIKSLYLSSQGERPNLSKICRDNDISRKEIEGLLSRSEYKNWTNFVSATNHSIKSVEFVGKRKTYDLVNVGEHHNFAILTSNGTGVFTHNCLTRNERGNILEIFSPNKRVKEVLNDLLKKRLNVEFNMRLWIRDLCKYGDFFLHLHIDKEYGIFDVLALPSEEIHREEGVEGEPGRTRFRWDTQGMIFEDWQIAHFRLLEDTRRLPYGRSVLDPARKLWKQLQLAEDAMLVYRIVRAPERRVFYIDVGNIDDADVLQYIEDIKTRLKRQPVVDSRNGNSNRKYNPPSVEEDYFIPVRGDKSSKIDTLPGATNLGDIMDIEYLQNKLFAAIKVPKPYLNYTESIPGGSLLSQSDLRFARTINMIQECVLMELRRIANIHLLFLGFEDDIDNFDLQLTNPSTQQVLLNMETWKSKLEVFSQMFTPEGMSPASYTWAMENVMGFSKEEIKLILKQKKVEKKLFMEIESAAESYKKIGLFKDLDKKYENPHAAIQTPGEGGEEGLGDGGAGGFGGGFDGDIAGGGMDAGIDDLDGDLDAAGGGDLEGDLGADLGAAGIDDGPTEEPVGDLAEIKRGRLHKLLKASDDRFDNFYEELMEHTLKGEEENDISKENKLFENHILISAASRKMSGMINRIDERIKSQENEVETESEGEFEVVKKKPAKKRVIQEIEEIEISDGKLQKESEQIANKARDVMDRLDSINKLKGEKSSFKRDDGEA